MSTRPMHPGYPDLEQLAAYYEACRAYDKEADVDDQHDDAVLAGVLRRFLNDEEDGWGSLAYVSLNGEHNGFMHPYLTIDGSTGTLSEVEVAALRRAMGD